MLMSKKRAGSGQAPVGRTRIQRCTAHCTRTVPDSRFRYIDTNIDVDTDVGTDIDTDM